MFNFTNSSLARGALLSLAFLIFIIGILSSTLLIISSKPIILSALVVIASLLIPGLLVAGASYLDPDYRWHSYQVQQMEAFEDAYNQSLQDRQIPNYRTFNAQESAAAPANPNPRRDWPIFDRTSRNNIQGNERTTRKESDTLLTTNPHGARPM